jgi:hypothetical protein
MKIDTYFFFFHYIVPISTYNDKRFELKLYGKRMYVWYSYINRSCQDTENV